MGFYSVWPTFVCVSLLVGLAATPWFGAADAPPNPRPNRLVTVDGLRGFLALAVVFHHAAVYHRYLLDGAWVSPPSRFYASLGQVGVAFFFMITGYLFWTQMLRAEGKPSWAALYIGRVFRIAPLYLAAALGVFALVAAATGLHLREPVLTLFRHVCAWLALGFFPEAELNLTNAKLWLADVTWTLRCEWFFYLSLPLLAFGARRRKLDLVFVLILLAVSLGSWRATYISDPASSLPLVTLFLFGMLNASLKNNHVMLKIGNVWGSAFATGLLALLFYFPTVTSAMAPQLLIFATMHLFLGGSNLFGLLQSRPALRLGDISYGIYLLQGFALAAAFRPSPLRALDLSSPLFHWLLTLLASVLTVVLATIAHVWIERPGIAVGKALVKRWRLKQGVNREAAAKVCIT